MCAQRRQLPRNPGETVSHSCRRAVHKSVDKRRTHRNSQNRELTTLCPENLYVDNTLVNRFGLVEGVGFEPT